MTVKSIKSGPVQKLRKLKRQFRKELKGYREIKYQILANAMAEVVTLRTDENELEAFILAAEIERPTVQSESRSWITVEAVSFVTHNKQLAWKGARVLDYLYDVKKIPLDNLAQEIRQQGGIEKILKIAAKENPRREVKNEADEEEQEGDQDQEDQEDQEEGPQEDQEEASSSEQPRKRWRGGNRKTGTKMPEVSEESIEESEIAVSISPDLRTKLHAIKVGRRVKLIGVRADKADWVDVMLEVQEVRLIKR